MTTQQLAADKGEGRPNYNKPPDDSRRPGELRRTTGRERQHRDRGNASNSDKWRDNLRREAD